MADTQGIQQAQKTFDWASQQGQQLLSQLGISLEQAKQLEAQYGDVARDYFKQQIERGGFNDVERGGVLGLDSQNGVRGLGELSGVGDDEARKNFLTDDERRGIEGDPDDPLGYLHSDTIGEYMQRGGEAQDKAVEGLRSGLNESIDPSKLALSSRYGSDIKSRLAGTTGKLDSAVNDPSLGLDSEFAENYELTPEQQKDIINSAATDVASKYQGEVEDAARRGDAAGIGPLGQSALRSRLLR